MKILYKIASQFYLMLSRIAWINSSKMTEGQAEKILRDAGYPFKPLWGELPKLSENTKDLSIIIPVYNSERFLAKCLDSILNQQTQFDYEVICINDGSKDSSLQILNRYKELFSNKMVVVSQQNLGISTTRNNGIAMAKGEFVGFLDNDDTVSPLYVEKIMQRARETGADIIQTAYDNVNTKNELLWSVSKGDHVVDAGDTDGILAHTQGYIWGGALKKSLFKNVRFPMGFWYEDMITRLVMVRLAKRVATIGEPLYYYLIHDTNASKTLWKSDGVKSIDQYWLARSLAEYSVNAVGCSVDDVLYHLLLDEYGLMFMYRMANMKPAVAKSAFTLAGRYLQSLHYCCNTLTPFKSDIEKSLKSGNYYAWLLRCKSQYYSQKC